MKRHGWIIKSQSLTTERSHICMSQKYHCRMMIEAEWGDLQHTNSPCDIFTHFSNYFQLDLGEIFFLFNEGWLKDIRSKEKPRLGKHSNNSRFSITVLWVGSAEGVNGTVIFLEKVTKVKPRIIGTNLVTIYGLPGVSCVLPNKAAYMDYETW